MTAVLASHNPELLDTYGVGRDTAAALLIAVGDNPGWLRNEASFGKTQRHCLNRGGDRQANCALRTIVLSRPRWDRRTRCYLDLRIAEGKSRREAIRCLKRYVAREIYNVITHNPRHDAVPAAA